MHLKCIVLFLATITHLVLCWAVKWEYFYSCVRWGLVMRWKEKGRKREKLVALVLLLNYWGVGLLSSYCAWTRAKDWTIAPVFPQFCGSSNFFFYLSHFSYRLYSLSFTPFSPFCPVLFFSFPILSLSHKAAASKATQASGASVCVFSFSDFWWASGVLAAGRLAQGR